MEPTVRVRFAPSPTGHLHIGGARTAIYNWAFARGRGGSFVLRIDDTDAERSTQENTDAILRALRWLGLDWDEGPEVGGPCGPYFQTQRGELYAAALDLLESSGRAYPCFCSVEDLEAKRDSSRSEGGVFGYDRTCRALSRSDADTRIAAGEPHVWRIGVPEDRGDIVIEDAIRGQVRWPAEVMDDFILVRTDGSPTYMFATVVDDWKMGITHIIRGDDHLSNTPRQIVVYEALGAAVPVFGHMSLICGADGKRLSKRHGATSVESYRDEGYLPEALLNYLALLGWSLDDKTTVFDRDTLLKDFDLARVSRNPAVWDPDKLDWMNGVYIRQLAPEAFAGHVAEWLVAARILAPSQAGESDTRDLLVKLAPLVQERVKRLDEVGPWVGFLFVAEDDFVIDAEAAEKALGKTGARPALESALAALDELPDGGFEAEAVERALRALPETLGMKPRDFFQPVRVGVSGSTVSPPLFESIALLGKERTLARLRKALLQAGDPLDTP